MWVPRHLTLLVSRTVGWVINCRIWSPFVGLPYINWEENEARWEMWWGARCANRHNWNLAASSIIILVMIWFDVFCLSPCLAYHYESLCQLTAVSSHFRKHHARWSIWVCLRRRSPALLNYHMEWKIIISWNWHPVTGIVRKPMDDNQNLNTTNEEPSTPLLPFGGALHTLA